MSYDIGIVTLLEIFDRIFEYEPMASWYRRFAHRIQARRSASWPRADATIQHAKAQEVKDEGRRVGWHPVVAYQYVVNGISYRGRTYGEIWYYDDNAAQETADSLIGATLPVRYNPMNPAKSLHLPSDGGPPQLLPENPDPRSGLITISLQ